MTNSLLAAALDVLSTADPAAKVTKTRHHAARWRQGDLTPPSADELASLSVPSRPARPDAPQLMAPNKMPKRSKAGQKGRVALLHAIAHIELNAIDLGWDIVLRAADQDMPTAFFDDWVQVADDEAKHFKMVDDRLRELDSFYGAHPAHDGLWEAAEDTHHDLLARLAIVPMVLEARGLDATPPTVTRLMSHGDKISAEILDLIAEEEIDHVRAGRVWFEFLCSRGNLPPIETWHALLVKHFKGKLKPPFNDEAREAAGLTAAYYATYSPAA